MRFGTTITALALVVLLGACEQAAPAATGGTSPTSVDRAPVKVAYVKDLSVPDADEHALPALQAVRLAFRKAAIRNASAVAVEVEEFDLSRDAEALGSIEADAGYVALVVAPGVDADRLPAGLEMPTVSLSGLGAGLDPWVRFVAPLSTVTGTLVERLGGPHTCVLAEETPPDPLFDLLAGRLAGAEAMRIDPADAGAAALSARCRLVVWAGGPDAGAEAVEALEHVSVPVVGGDRLLDPDFLASAGPAAEGTFALCSCDNVSVSTELAARRFIQDYQSEHGVAPGAFAVEGWDAAHVILRALDEGEPTRAALEGALRTLTAVDGLDGVRRFGPDGEPLEPSSLLRLYRVEGGRWVRSSWDEVRRVG